MSLKPNEMAFPLVTPWGVPDNQRGLTKREFMATMLYAGILSRILSRIRSDSCFIDDPCFAKRAVEVADLLLTELDK